MRNRGQLVVGVVIVLLGTLLLIGNLFHINPWAFFWPLVLIGLGVWMLLRPQTLRSDGRRKGKILGDICRGGEWQVRDEEFWVLIGDIKLDMTTAQIPEGETVIRTYGFVGSIRLRVPERVGVSVSSTAFITDARMLGHKQESLLSPLHQVSDDYETF